MYYQKNSKISKNEFKRLNTIYITVTITMVEKDGTLCIGMCIFNNINGVSYLFSNLAQIYNSGIFSRVDFSCDGGGTLKLPCKREPDQFSG